MSLVKRNHAGFPSFLDEFLSPDWFGGIEKSTKAVPAVNIRDNETNFELELAVPGRKKEDFKIEIENEILTISSEIKPEKEDTHYTRKEFSFTSFKRAFNVPESVAVDKIDAAYVAGVLTLTIPKKEEALPKPKRNIEIA